MGAIQAPGTALPFTPDLADLFRLQSGANITNHFLSNLRRANCAFNSKHRAQSHQQQTCQVYDLTVALAAGCLADRPISLMGFPAVPDSLAVWCTVGTLTSSHQKDVCRSLSLIDVTIGSVPSRRWRPTGDEPFVQLEKSANQPRASVW